MWHSIADFFARLFGRRKKLTIPPQTLAVGVVGQAYLQPLHAQNGKLSYIWKVQSGKLPSGTLLRSSSGTIAGTPEKAGKFTFSVSVTDSQP